MRGWVTPGLLLEWLGLHFAPTAIRAQCSSCQDLTLGAALKSILQSRTLCYKSECLSSSWRVMLQDLCFGKLLVFCPLSPVLASLRFPDAERSVQLSSLAFQRAARLLL